MVDTYMTNLREIDNELNNNGGGQKEDESKYEILY